MRALKTSERRLLQLTLIVGGCLYLYSSLIEPRVVRAMDLRGRIGTVTSELAQSRALIVHRDEIELHSEILQKQLSAAGDTDTEMKKLFEELERLARASGLLTTSLRPSRTRDLGFYTLLGVDMQAEGSERDVARFLHRLKDSTQLLRVDSLQLAALREEGRLRAQLLVVRILS